MKAHIVPSLILLTILLSCDTSNQMQTQTEFTPPVASKTDSVLTIHGDSRVDPYFWMRLSDQQKTSKEPDEQTQKVRDYLNAENQYKDQVLKHTKDLQEKLYDEIVGRIKQDDESVPYRKNGYWYYVRYEQGMEYPIYCRKKENLDNVEEIMLNVNDMASGYDYYNISGLRVSFDNKILAFGEDTLSRRVYTIKFKNLETGEMLDDQLHNTQPGGAWAADNKTFFYTSKNRTTLLSEKIWRHTLGGGQREDGMVYEEQDNSYYIGVYNSKSNEYVIIYNSSTLTSDYHILSVDDPNGTFRQFTPRETPHEYSIEHFEDKFYIVTNWDATNFRLMETPEQATDRSNWKEVIGHREDVLLSDIEVFLNYLVLEERANALTHLRIIDQRSGDEHYLDFGEPAYVVYTSTNTEFETENLRYGYSSLTTPNTTYDYNMGTKEKVLLKRQEVVGGHDPDDYITKRIFAEARDGTMIPISLVYGKDVIPGQETPLLQYAYGSYGSSSDPWFRSAILSPAGPGIYLRYCSHSRRPGNGQAMV